MLFLFIWLLLKRLLADTLSARTVIELHTDIETDAWNEYSVTRRLQARGDLGERMLAALGSGLTAGAPRVLILGGDVPTVPINHLRELLASNADVSLGPAEDGGYYAIACSRVDPEMFTKVATQKIQILQYGVCMVIFRQVDLNV